MAGRPDSPPAFSNDANLVGNAFVIQYYNVLHQSPEIVHRFYRDESKLSYAEAGANANFVATQDKIHDIITSMDFGGVRAEIKTVDSQESLNGSVLVVVTGLLSPPNGADLNFVRTFFLARQERGYFVLNDIFRYLNGESESKAVTSESKVASESKAVISESKAVISESKAVASESKAVASESKAVASESKVVALDSKVVASVTSESKAVAEENITAEIDQGTSGPPQNVESEADANSIDENPPETDGLHEISKKVEAFAVEDTLEEEVTDLVPAHEDVTVKQLATPEAESSGTAKLSYASVLRARNESLNASFISRPAAPRRTFSTTQSTSVVTTQTAAPIVPVENTTETGSDGKSIYVRNLPLSITQEELENEFQKFGSLRPGGTNLRNQKQGVCFAFIEYENSSSAQSAIEASPVVIGGRQIYIEERKFMPTGSLGGARRPNQNWGFQNNGRGRGYSGGRSGGRGYNLASRS